MRMMPGCTQPNPDVASSEMQAPQQLRIAEWLPPCVSVSSIEAVQTFSRALTATNVVAEMPFNDSSDTRKPAVEMASLLEMPAAWQHHDKEF
jgi:hypothetical protein